MSQKYIDDDDVIRAKVVVLGSANVGKTCLVIKFDTGDFPEGTAPTIGASYVAKKMKVNKDNAILLQIWDTAGQERFKSMASMYYRGADAAILVFDVTDHRSFEAVKDWVKELRAHNDVSSDLVLAIAANKIDLGGPNSAKDLLLSQAKEYAKEINASFIETSAKSSQGIQSLFEIVAQNIFTIKLQKSSTEKKPVVFVQSSPAKQTGCCFRF